MINFHKVSGKPAKVNSGEEHIWYSYPNGIYVADNQGNPRLISPGKQVGTQIPVGTPQEPGMFYYNTSNGKNYISTATKWVEIGTGAIPGTGGGSSIAGNVMVDDSANNFTSVDVEGVLAEIAEKFPWYFGQLRLQNYTGNVNTLVASNEKYLTAAATNKPDNNTKTGWIIQRQAANNKTYGSFVADDGSFYTRVGNTYVKFANQADLSSLKSTVDTNLAALGSKKIIVGTGLTTNGKTINEGQSVSLSQDILDKLNAAGEGASFVKKTGDTMTGALRLSAPSNAQSTIQFNSTGSKTNVLIGDDPIGRVRDSDTYGEWGGPRWKMVDVTRGLDIITYYPDGALDIVGLQRTRIGNATNPGYVVIESGSASRSVDIVAKRNTFPLFIQGASGSMHIGTGHNKDYNFINSYSGRATGQRSFYIGGGSWSRIRQVWLNSDQLYSSGNAFFGGSINIGFTQNDHSNTFGDNCARFYTNKYGNDGSGNARTNYVAIYWDYKARNFIFDSRRGEHSWGAVYLNAHGYINRSSIKYKDVIEEFNEDVLETIENTKPYLYTLKKDPKKEKKVGLIVEKNVPKLLVSNNDGIDGYSLTTYLWKGVQELSAKVTKLEEQLAALGSTE